MTTCRRSSRPYTALCRSLHHFTLRIGDKEDKVSTLQLKPCTKPTAPPVQPRVRGRPLSSASGIFPRQGQRQPAGYISPHNSQHGTVLPWPAARGFCTPCRVLDHAAARPARNRRPRGLGEPCGGSTPLLHMRNFAHGGHLTHMWDLNH
jgi:hypothetical protein